MGSFKKGLMGGFSGKVGNLVGASWKSIDYMKSLPRKTSKAASGKQQMQQLRFALAVDFIRPISALVTQGYQSEAKAKVTGYNVAVSQVLRDAIGGTFPNYHIDYSKVKISRGTLPRGTNFVAQSKQSNTIDLTWKDNTADEKLAHTDDELMLLIFNPAKNRYIFQDDVAKRGDGHLLREVPTDFSGDMVHVYAAFVGRDHDSVSESMYLGEVLIF